MAVRSVSVRYSASVGQLVSELGRAAKANDKLATSAEKAGQKQDTAGESATRLAKGGAVVALGLGVAVAKFAEFDAAMSGAQAATQTTGAELNNLRDAAIKAGADTQYSATEAARAITELSKAGIGANDILGGGLQGALNLAAAGQMDVAEAAETAATAMTQFNLSGGQVNHVADLLAAGAGKAQGSVSDMGMALKQAGLVASSTGLSVEETTAGLTAFASAGLIGSDAGTSFKSMLQRLTPQSKEAANLMDDLGISAYDAGGNFIGLEGFAGNLQTALRDLTPEQRNSALATIFGSDAVRAANVLYEEGATGIAKWTTEVNQQGFAAKQAADLTNNLKGDIERLGGAFDTTLIQAGSGANDTLRTLVQTAESLLDVVGMIPGPVLTGAAAFGALALVGPKIGVLARTITGPLSSGMATFRGEMALHRALATQVSGGYQRLGDESAKAATQVSRSSVAMSAARSTMGGLKGAASGMLGVLGGPWGVALMAATAGVTLWAQGQADAQAAADALSSTIDTQTGKFTAAANTSIISSLTGDLSAEDVRLVESLGFNFGTLADAALKGGPAFEDQRSKIAALMEQHQRGFGILSQEGRALEGLLRSYDRSGSAADKARIQQQILAQASSDAAVAQSDMADSANAAERGISAVGTAAGTAAGGLEEATDPTASLNKLLGDLGAKSKEATEALDLLRSATDLLGGGARAQQAAQDQQAASIDKVREAAEAAAEAVKKKTDKDYTSAEKTRDVAQANREYREALRGVATNTLDRIKVQQGENVSVQGLTKTYELGRAEIVRQLQARGLHGKALQAEADKIIGTKGQFGLLLAEYKKTPAQVATTVKTPGTPAAKQEIKTFTGLVNGVPQFKTTKVSTPGSPAAKSEIRTFTGLVNGVPQFATTTVNANTSTAVGRIQALKAELAGIDRSVTSTITIRRIQNDIKLETNGVASAGGNIVTAYAAGGYGDVANAHMPQVVPAGSWRVFGEPETQGEAYIPFANDWRRPRAKAITGEVVQRLGGDVTWNAAGGLYSFATGGYATISAKDSTAVRALVFALQDPLRAIADAAQAIIGQQARVTSAQKVVTVANRNQATAKARVDSTTKANEADKKAQAALKLRLIDLKKAADATKGVTAADRTYKAVQEQLARLNLRQTASAKAKTEATAAYSKAATAAKDAVAKLTDQQKALTDARKELADAQKQIADEAGRVAEQFRSAFEPKSVDPRKWISSMTTGSGDLTQFLAKIQALRKGGLSEGLVQQIIGAGVTNGGRLAENILRDKSTIGGLNSSYSQLTSASNNLGLGVVSGQLAPSPAVDYTKFAVAFAQVMPLTAIAQTLGALPADVKTGVTDGMVAAAGIERRYQRSTT